MEMLPQVGDEKNLGILCLALIAVVAMFSGDGMNLATNVVCAIGGIVTGQAQQK